MDFIACRNDTWIRVDTIVSFSPGKTATSHEWVDVSDQFGNTYQWDGNTIQFRMLLESLHRAGAM